jgi:hypothetical protein
VIADSSHGSGAFTLEWIDAGAHPQCRDRDDPRNFR